MKKKVILVVICLFGVILSACRSSDEFKEQPLDEPLIELRLSEKVEKDNRFAIDLFKTAYANTEGANLFVSPLSVSMALQMALNGAAGATAKEMKTALRAEGYSLEQLNEYSQSLRRTLTEVDPETEVTLANSIWYRVGFPVKDAFLQVNRSYYEAEVSALDFDLPEARTTINAWCAEQTKDKIKTILDDPIPADAVMYLVNAVYFKGVWQTEFDKERTRKGDFYPETGASTRIDRMSLIDTFNFVKGETADWLEIPYRNHAFSMALILPHNGQTTGDIIGLLDSETWNLKMTQLNRREVLLFLPRFKVECTYRMEERILPDMGMKLPFSTQADFSGISNIDTHPTRISKVIHKTFVEVNEQGTEAAAVTGMETIVGSNENRVYFDVNKPFLFAIRENSTGVILFIGKIGEIQ